MRILHILGKDITIGTEAAFLDMVTALLRFAPHVRQSAIIPRNRYLAASLERMQVPYDRERFDGLLDFRTSRNIQKIVHGDEFDVILLHSRDAPALAPNTMRMENFIGFEKTKEQLPPITFVQETANPIERIETQTPDDAFIIGTMTWLTPDKKLNALITSIKELPNVHLWIAGEGPQLTSLQHHTERQGLRGRVHFLGRQVNRAAFLQSINACFIPPRRKGCDRLTLESWSMNVPVISALGETKSPGKHSASVLAVPADRAELCTETLDNLLQDKALVARLTKNGLQVYSDAYAPEKTVPVYLDMFESYRR